MTAVPPANGRLVVTVDELRALHRLNGDLRLPRFVAGHDDAEDTPAAVDAAALRGLAARGLLDTATIGAPTLHPVLADLLAPYHSPTTIIEIEAEVDGRLTNTSVAGGEQQPWGVLREHDEAHIAGLLTLTSETGTGYDAVERLCHLDAVSAHVDGEPVTVTAAAHAEADELALQGDVPEAVARLVAGGATETGAKTWVDAVLHRRAAVAVTVAHLRGDTAEAADLRWLVAGDGTAWQVTADARSPHADAEPADDITVSVITPVGAPVLRAALAHLVGATAAAEVPN